MRPGPTLIKKCSNCSNLIKERTFLSSNSFGARFWTDGYCDAGGLIDYPWLVKCPYCNALIWIDEQEKIDELCILDTRLERIEGKFTIQYVTLYKDVKPVQTPIFDEYCAELEKGISSKKKEQYVRIRAWRSGNDKRRNLNVKSDLSEFEKQNLYALEDLLDECNDNHRILKAEIKRELGDFEGALKLLENPIENRLMKTAFFIKKLVCEYKTDVAEIIYED